MMVSVVIVSYNVKYFLEQCLCSVERAMAFSLPATTNSPMPVEVFVVDNHSTDGTVEYLQPRFSSMQFISNSKNAGFAKANNQALQLATGKYVLFLNPDTIVPEDIFDNCVSFMDTHPDAGALGVRMVDGSGKFLKESKRGFPSPWVAWCKMSGLTKLFPRSKIFAGYYQGHLPEMETNGVDALAGACMFVRKEVLDNIGGFDEQFFMYAEDIDLSFRIKQANYRNYYCPQITIIHFKGESTSKDYRYVRLFYGAMIQFVRKHMHTQMGRVASALLVFFVRLKASLSMVQLWFTKKKKESSYKKNLLLVGDKQVTSKLAKNLPASYEVNFCADTGEDQLSKTITKTGCNEIVLCESPDLGFKKIIQLFSFFRINAYFKICGHGSKSIVGSNSNSRQGEAIGLH